MNMNQNPAKDQLRNLLAACDDEAGHHMLWVGCDGGVHIDPIPYHLAPIDFARQIGDALRFRFDTFRFGNGQVGPAASSDDAFVSDLFASLERSWQTGHRGTLFATRPQPAEMLRESRG